VSKSESGVWLSLSADRIWSFLISTWIYYCIRMSRTN